MESKLKPPKIVRCPNITNNHPNSLSRNKDYKVVETWGGEPNENNGWGFIIYDDQEYRHMCLEKGCAKLKGGDWIIVEREQ